MNQSIEEAVQKAAPKIKLAAKLALIGAIVIVLMILSAMISSLVGERSQRRDAAVEDISSKWGAKQTVAGPILIIPYREFERVESDKGLISTVVSVHYATFLPETLAFSGDVGTELRHRGIYEAVLYAANLGISGHFSKPDFSKLGIDAKDILWNRANLAMGISDLRGIRDSVKLDWGKSELPFSPGGSDGFPFAGGIHCPVSAAEGGDFKVKLALNGSHGLGFLPLGRQTTVSLRSPWPSPSFDGQFLPVKSAVTDKGFSADWQVLELARSFPQFWKDSAVNSETLNGSSFGVTLLQTASAYQQNERAVNYAILFILLTFSAFFLFEVMGGLQLHFLHYTLVGSALVVFYLLLLSLSEHIGYAPAYWSAAAATVALVGGYCRSVLGQQRRALLMASLLGLLYGYLFIVIQLEDFALLVGSAGVFASLAAIMWLTRRINWNQVGESRA